jgi:hypothetical protein
MGLSTTSIPSKRTDQGCDPAACHTILASHVSSRSLRLDYDMHLGPLRILPHALLVRRLLEKNLPGALTLLERKSES